MGKVFAIVGNWARDGREKGITVLEYKAGMPQLSRIGHIADEVCAGALLADAQRGLLYVTNEVEHLQGGGGDILIYRVDPQSGSLTFLQSFPSYYAKPDNLLMTKSKKYLFAVHHGTRGRITRVGRDEEGNFYSRSEFGDNGISMFSLKQDGTIDGLCDIAPAEAGGEIPSIMHSFEIDPSGKLGIATDIERDVISLYEIDEKEGKMKLIQRKKDVPGHAPRYGFFHPDFPLYLKNNEQHLSLDSYRYDAGKGELLPFQTLEYLAQEKGKHKKYEVSDLVTGSGGRMLYVSVRCCNCIVSFSLDEEGKMKEGMAYPSGGESPRGICISPDGKYMYIMHDVSRDITCMEILDNGELKDTGYRHVDNCPGVMRFVQF